MPFVKVDDGAESIDPYYDLIAKRSSLRSLETPLDHLSLDKSFRQYYKSPTWTKAETVVRHPTNLSRVYGMKQVKDPKALLETIVWQKGVPEKDRKLPASCVIAPGLQCPLYPDRPAALAYPKQLDNGNLEAGYCLNHLGDMTCPFAKLQMRSLLPDERDADIEGPIWCSMLPEEFFLPGAMVVEQDSDHLWREQLPREESEFDEEDKDEAGTSCTKPSEENKKQVVANKHEAESPVEDASGKRAQSAIPSCEEEPSDKEPEPERVDEDDQVHKAEKVPTKRPAATTQDKGGDKKPRIAESNTAKPAPAQATSSCNTSRRSHPSMSPEDMDMFTSSNHFPEALDTHHLRGRA